MPRIKSWVWPAAVAGLLAIAGIGVTQTFWEGWRPVRVILVDDAMISMAFARSLAEGCGLVWYCGYPRVEGFTNLGWTIYMAFWHVLGIPPEFTSVPILLTGLLLLGLYIRGVYWLGEREGGAGVGTWAAWIAALFPPVLFHFTSGLEAAALAVFLVYFWLELLGKGRWWVLALLASVGTFLRMDFVGWVGAMGLVGFLPGSVLAHRRKALLASLLVGLAVAGLTTLWRYFYYGAWVPNTYVLKVQAVPSGLRWANGAIATLMHVGMNLPLYALAGWGLWRQRTQIARVMPALALVAASFLYNVHVGGDIFENSMNSNRFLLNSFVVGFLFAAEGLISLSASWLRWTVVALISYGLPLSPTFLYRWKLFFTQGKKEYYAPIDRYFSPGDTLYIGPAGTVPYFFRQYVWRDLLGKVDVKTAREGHFLTCNGRPPLLYWTGHTRIDIQGLLTQAKGCVGWFRDVPPDWCSRTDPPVSLQDYWWKKYVSLINPCHGSRPAFWYVFPSDSLKRCFCKQFAPIVIENKIYHWRRVRPPGTCE